MSTANKKPHTSEFNRVFGRLHKDGTVGTLTTLGYIVGQQVVIHPEQDRTLTIREFARLQVYSQMVNMIVSTDATGYG